MKNSRGRSKKSEEDRGKMERRVVARKVSVRHYSTNVVLGNTCAYTKALFSEWGWKSFVFCTSD